jgi:NADP-dependent 3-hydroxy acid dehydrogenase YdfG
MLRSYSKWWFRRLIDINVKGLLYVSKAIIPNKKEIIILSSVPLLQKKFIQTEMYAKSECVWILNPFELE